MPSLTFFPAPAPTELPATTAAASVIAWDDANPAIATNIEKRKHKAHKGPPLTILTGLRQETYGAFPLFFSDKIINTT